MKSSAVAGLVLVLVLIAGVATAHPAKEVKIEFDPDGKMLMVTAVHDTKDVAKHFIGTVEVDLNGDKIIVQKFKSQIGADAQKAHFWVHDAKIGDEIKVTATCNISGKKTVSLKVEKKVQGEEPKTGK